MNAPLAVSWRARMIRAWRDGLPAPWDWLLAAATVAYRGALALRGAGYAVGVRRARRLPCRVVAVGNLTVGGTGKTPMVEVLARALLARGRRVVILSRGYGRRSGPPIGLVSDGRTVLLDSRAAGDEPLLLARRLAGVPVVVGRDRYRAGAWALPRFRPDVLLLDDGFQQRRLRADVDVVCLDARVPWGARGLLPRGSLREPPAGLARAHLLVVTHADGATDAARVEAEVRRHAPTAPIVHARYEADAVEDLGSGRAVPAPTLRSCPVLAFAGIAAPERFAATLAGLGIAVRELVTFPDHHPYGPADLTALEDRARTVGAEALVTTEKDAVRLPPGGGLAMWCVQVRLRLEEGVEPWWAALDARLTVP